MRDFSFRLFVAAQLRPAKKTQHLSLLLNSCSSPPTPEKNTKMIFHDSPPFIWFTNTFSHQVIKHQHVTLSWCHGVFSPVSFPGHQILSHPSVHRQTQALKQVLHKAISVSMRRSEHLHNARRERFRKRLLMTSHVMRTPPG